MLGKYVKTGCALYTAKLRESGVGGEVKEEKEEEGRRRKGKKKKETNHSFLSINSTSRR
jgi:hypothetical protein